MRYIIRHAKERNRKSTSPCIKLCPTQQNANPPHLIPSLTSHHTSRSVNRVFWSSQKHLAIIVMVCIFWTLFGQFNGPSQSCKTNSRSNDQTSLSHFILLLGSLTCLPPVCTNKIRIFFQFEINEFLTFRYIYRMEMMLFYGCIYTIIMARGAAL